ncbi:MAG: ABC transporter permease [Thermoplasmata archaeon]
MERKRYELGGLCHIHYRKNGEVLTSFNPKNTYTNSHLCKTKNEWIRMVSMAKENLFHEKSKVAITIGGVVLSVFLIFTISGVYYALDSMMDNIVLKAGADLWVTSKGASGSLHSPSLLPIGLNESLEGVEGVQEVTPLIRHTMSTIIEGKKVLIILNGYDTERDLGGPWKVIEGSAEPSNGEIIVDRVFAVKNNRGIGDYMSIGGKSFRIVGISDETNMMIAYVFFVTFKDARSFLPENLTNYFLVKVDSSSDLNTVKDTIESTLPDISVSTAAETARAYKDEVLGGFLPIIFVIDSIGVLVGVIVVGLLVYTMTIEKNREYGILKALGATNTYLYKNVLAQALIISMLGYLAGAIISTPATYLIQHFVPEFTISLPLEIYLWTFLMLFLTGIFTSFVPVRRLTRIDPAVVFKG